MGFIGPVGDGSWIDCVDRALEVLGDSPVMDVIHAIFLRSDDSGYLAIAKNALDAHLTGSNDDQVRMYLISAFRCLSVGARKFSISGSEV